VDIVVAVDFPEGPLRKNKFYRRFDLLHDTFFIAVADDHPLAGKGEVPVEDLSDQCWIMAPAVAPCRELTLVACMAAGFSPDIRHNVDNWNSVLALVAANCGVAFVPRLAMPQGGFPGVTLLKPSGIQGPSRHWFAVTRSGSENNPGILAVMKGLQDLALELDRKP
jgi:DNA-binding transcriptional LysR family regulator